MSIRPAILLVDDEARNLDALEAILGTEEYRLLRADNADAALKALLDNDDIAAIVLDIQMPQLNGLELAKMIKGTKRFREIPILFLTAHMVDETDILVGYGIGAVDYLTKPLNPKILKQKVQVFGELFRKTRALAELNENLEARVLERTAELEESQAALLRAAKQKDEFLAVLAHELRNPLAPLRTGVGLLTRALGSSAPVPSAAKTLKVMDRQLDHLVRLIDDLLDISRISNGVLSLKIERTDLASVVGATVDNFRSAFEQKKVTLDVTGLDGDVGAAIDATRVGQIVGNLLHNAQKFTPEGGRVAVDLHVDKHAATISVSDTGVGIPADQLQRVFDMFARVSRKTPSSDRGAGIGLALAKKLAEMHGGSLSAYSEGEGKGTKLTLVLPLEHVAEKASPARTQPPPAMSTPAAMAASAAAATAAPVAAPSTHGSGNGSGNGNGNNNGSGRGEGSGNGHGVNDGALEILVIEDSVDVADTLADWLSDEGHRVHVARTGETGVEMALSTKPDVVLCDVGLPEMDGTEVCRRVRAEARGFRPLMVALTGWGQTEDRRKTKEAGFDHHLVKPVSLDSLTDLLKAASSSKLSGAIGVAQPSST